MNLFIPSYGRPNAVYSAEFFKSAQIVVPESQREDYEKNYPGRIIAIPDSKDGKIARKRNAILDYAFDQGLTQIVMIDDDFVEAGHNINRKVLNENQMLTLFEQGFQLCLDLQLHLFGFNSDIQPLHQEVNRPFSFGRFFYWILGILVTKRRFDERLDRQDDMDFWLQHIHQDKATLKFNHIGIQFRMKDRKQSGGIEFPEETMEDSERLLKKWGKDVLNYDKKRGVFLTPRSPYKGV